MTIATALFSSESQTWNSPQVVVDRLLAFDPRGVVLDPCSNESSVVGAREEWRIERGEDGLAREWPDLGLVYINPPYDALERWAAKMAREAARNVEIIALIPARLDTVAFQKHILPSCNAIAFWRGRMKYGAGLAHTSQITMFAGLPELVEKLEEGENVAPFPSCLPYWGVRPRQFARAFDSAGWVVVPR